MSNISEHLARYKLWCETCKSEVDAEGRTVPAGTAHDLFFIGALDGMEAHFTSYGHHPAQPLPTKDVGRESPVL